MVDRRHDSPLGRGSYQKHLLQSRTGIGWFRGNLEDQESLLKRAEALLLKA